MTTLAVEISEARKLTEGQTDWWGPFMGNPGADADELSDALYLVMARLDDLRIFALASFEEELPSKKRSHRRQADRLRAEYIRTELKGVMGEIFMMLRANAIDHNTAELAELQEAIENEVYQPNQPIVRMNPPKESFMDPKETGRLVRRQKRKFLKRISKRKAAKC